MREIGWDLVFEILFKNCNVACAKKKAKQQVAPPRMFSQRNNPYCELLQNCMANIGNKFVNAIFLINNLI